MSNRRRGTARRTPARGVARRRTSARGVARRGAKMGHTNGCPPGMMMGGAGQCVPVGSARRGARNTSRRRR